MYQFSISIGKNPNHIQPDVGVPFLFDSPERSRVTLRLCIVILGTPKAFRNISGTFHTYILKVEGTKYDTVIIFCLKNL